MYHENETLEIMLSTIYCLHRNKVRNPVTNPLIIEINLSRDRVSYIQDDAAIDSNKCKTTKQEKDKPGNVEDLGKETHHFHCES